ncbi:MAG: CoA transferase [Dehalococcoidia bacterium]
MLCDLGADVVRVESPAGDSIRRREPFVHEKPGLERSLAHILYNAGKRSVALDLETASGIETLSELLKQASVVIAPLEPIARLKDLLTEDSISELAPNTGLVLPVFRRNREAYATDLTAIAAGGQLFLNGDAQDPPNHPAGNLAYKQLSLATALAAMSMVIESSGGRTPGRIEVSMQEAVMWTTIQSANENYAHWGLPPPSRRGLGNVGGQTIFSTADGLYVSLYHHPPAFAAFARWYEELYGDGQYTKAPWTDGYYRFQNAKEIVGITVTVCASMDRKALVAEAQKRGILCVPVQNVEAIAQDSHLREREFYQKVRFDSLGEELEIVRPPFISSTYRSNSRPAPALGEHTNEVLREWCGLNLPEAMQR